MTSRFDRTGTNLIDLPSLVQNITSQRRDGVMTVRMGKDERFLRFTAGNLVALSGVSASTSMLIQAAEAFPAGQA